MGRRALSLPPVRRLVHRGFSQGLPSASRPPVRRHPRTSGKQDMEPWISDYPSKCGISSRERLLTTSYESASWKTDGTFFPGKRRIGKKRRRRTILPPMRPARRREGALRGRQDGRRGGRAARGDIGTRVPRRTGPLPHRSASCHPVGAPLLSTMSRASPPPRIQVLPARCRKPSRAVAGFIAVPAGRNPLRSHSPSLRLRPPLGKFAASAAPSAGLSRKSAIGMPPPAQWRRRANAPAPLRHETPAPLPTAPPAAAAQSPTAAPQGGSEARSGRR